MTSGNQEPPAGPPADFQPRHQAPTPGGPQYSPPPGQYGPPPGQYGPPPGQYGPPPGQYGAPPGQYGGYGAPARPAGSGLGVVALVLAGVGAVLRVGALPPGDWDSGKGAAQVSGLRQGGTDSPTKPV